MSLVQQAALINIPATLQRKMSDARRKNIFLHPQAPCTKDKGCTRCPQPSHSSSLPTWRGGSPLIALDEGWFPGAGTCSWLLFSWGTCFHQGAWRITACAWWPLSFTYLLAWQSCYCTCTPHFQPFESPCGIYSSSGGEQPKQQEVLHRDKPQVVFMWSFIVLKNSLSRPEDQCGKHCL